ncbi:MULTISPECIES: hypothetical protein [Flavobacterium]|uniref:Trimeric autotransporter adhesin YadA-like head domain-containing protein n=1 Tax=Flavobacterium jumunjinense TaxID=998845 RepID=A0ABV5GJV4_9FLAO|nr:MULTISPECIES: hypothetical protein [Flavobacterium]
MKKILLLTIAFCFPFYLFSQVGIGTTSPSPSSALEIKSTNAGLLIPRISLSSTTDHTTITSPETSLLIYNKSNVSDVTPGFYYWDSTWKRLDNPSSGIVGSSGGWNLNGNSLTTGNEYFGTSNYNPLNFRVNNKNFGRFHPNGGLALGSNAVANDNSAIAIGTNASATTSNEAIAIGSSSSASAYQSIAFGVSSSASGNETIALGKRSLASGYRSTAIGVGSNSSNNNSTAVGNSSVASGEQATAVGTEATASGQNATAIGYQAKANQANSIVLGNSTNNNNKVGIGTNTPDERLHVNGSVKIVDGNQGAGKVLVSDANGKATWTDINDTKTYGEIFRKSNLVLSSGAINLGTNGVGSGVTQNGTNIQVQTTGLYRISYTVSLRKNSGSSTNVEFYLGIYGSEIAGTRTYASVSNGETRTVSFVKLVNLNAYQAVSIYSSLSDSNINLLSGSNLIVELVK